MLRLFYQIPYTTTNLMITNSCNPGWELGYLLRAGAKWHGRRNPGDHKDPAGVTTAIIIPILHNHPDSFSDPAQFNPDRFFQDNTLNRHPYISYIPFSAGSRNCIGHRFAVLEEKVFLA